MVASATGTSWHAPPAAHTLFLQGTVVGAQSPSCTHGAPVLVDPPPPVPGITSAGALRSEHAPMSAHAPAAIPREKSEEKRSMLESITRRRESWQAPVAAGGQDYYGVKLHVEALRAGL